MTDVFSVLADPTRRRLLELIRARECSVGNLVKAVRISQPGVSQQLAVLRKAGLVKVRAHGKLRLYRLEAGPLRDIDQWLARYRPYFEAHLDALERHLDRTKERGA
jgi:DNA-binding transcriptional ArsR family regulator